MGRQKIQKSFFRFISVLEGVRDYRVECIQIRKYNKLTRIIVIIKFQLKKPKIEQIRLIDHERFDKVGGKEI